MEAIRLLTDPDPGYIASAVKSHVYDLNLRLLIYKEEDEWVAHALEMDLLGYGNSPREAKEAVKKAIEAQLEFASHIDNPKMAQFPAPKEFFTRWEKAQTHSVRGVFGPPDKCEKLKGRAEFVTIYSADIEQLSARQSKARFEPVTCG
jgi:hypothetical protein